MSHTQLIRGFLLVLVAGVTACAGSGENNQPQCRFTSECPPGNRCVNGSCVIEFGDGASVHLVKLESTVNAKRGVAEMMIALTGVA